VERDELLRRFEEVAALLHDLDLGRAWDEATEPERRVLVEELVEKVAVFPDHLRRPNAGARADNPFKTAANSQPRGARRRSPVPPSRCASGRASAR